MQSITLEKISITKLKTDIIVNAANSRLQQGTGVCGYIFDAAGPKELQKACDKIGGCKTGNAVITPGFKLCKYIVHAVGPIWHGGDCNEPQDLYGCYQKSMDLAKENSCHSIGFPLISAGVFGYPKDKAWRKALQSINDWFKSDPEYDIDVVFAILDDGILSLGIKMAQDLDIAVNTSINTDKTSNKKRRTPAKVSFIRIKASSSSISFADACEEELRISNDFIHYRYFSRFPSKGNCDYEFMWKMHSPRYETCFFQLGKSIENVFALSNDQLPVVFDSGEISFELLFDDDQSKQVEFNQSLNSFPEVLNILSKMIPACEKIHMLSGIRSCNDLNESCYFSMSDTKGFRRAQIPLSKERFEYLLNSYEPTEDNEWVIFHHPGHFLIYSNETKYCIFDAAYIELQQDLDENRSPDSISAVITDFVINQDPVQCPQNNCDEFDVLKYILAGK